MSEFNIEMSYDRYTALRDLKDYPQGYYSQSSPMSPSQKIIHMLGSPVRYIDKKFSSGSLKGSIFNLLAGTVGAGILGLPYAINLSGLYLGIIIILIGMLASLYSCSLLVMCSEETKCASYESIASYLYGKKMRKITEVNIMINNYGSLIAYILLLKELIPKSLIMLGVTGEIVVNGYFWAISVTLFVIYPLSLVKEISALRYTSLISFITVSYLTFIVGLQFFIMRGDQIWIRVQEAPAAHFDAFEIFQVCAIVLFSFTCQSSVVPIYIELQRPCVRRGKKFIFIALLTVMILYLIVGIFGFLTFYKEYATQGIFPDQILKADYGTNNIPVIIV
jgi:amino acid permease